MADVKVSWGLSENGLPIYIKDAKNGLECNAICIGCGGRLIAKQGSTSWHFAHYSGEGCSGESIVHFLAKYFLKTEKKKLAIPAFNVFYSESDIGGITYKEEKVLFGRSYTIENVIAECPVSPSLKPDCRLDLPETSETIWVEIFYKNRKDANDIEKIRAHGISCFEIDVSDLSYNTPKEDFVEAVFSKAQRRWLSVGGEKSPLDDLKVIVEQKVSSSNALLTSLAESFLNYICTNQKKWVRQVTWPVIEEKYGESISRSRPRVTDIHPDWVNKNGHWITTAITEKQGAPVYLVARIKNYQRVQPFAPFDQAVDRPVLYIDMAVKRALDDNHAFSLAWHNISVWDQALYEMAYKAEIKRVSETYRHYDWFASISAEEQAKFSLMDLNLICPSYLGKVSTYWNSYPATWRALIIKRYIIGQAVPLVLSVRAIASDPDLKRMLKLDEDVGAIEKRQMELHVWLNKLEEKKIVSKEEGRRYKLHRVPSHLSDLIAL